MKKTIDILSEQEVENIVACKEYINFPIESLLEFDKLYGNKYNHCFLSVINDESSINRFFDTLDENEITDISNCLNLSENLRNIAFSKGCVIENIHQPTQYMANQMFEIMFNACIVNSDDKNPIELSVNTIKILTKLFSNNLVNEENQMGFAKFYKNLTNPTSDIELLYQYLLSYINSETVIKYILNDHKTTMMEKLIILNPCLNKKDRTLYSNEFIKDYFQNKESFYRNSDHELFSTLVNGICRKNIEIDIELQEKLLSLNNNSINRSLSLSPKTDLNILRKLSHTSENNMDIIFNSTFHLARKELFAKEEMADAIISFCDATSKFEGNLFKANESNIHSFKQNTLYKIFNNCKTKKELNTFLKTLKKQKTILPPHNDILQFMVDIRIETIKEILS